MSTQSRSSRDRLLALLKERSLLSGPITLSNGQTSNFYFDCRRVTLNAEGARLVADAFLEIIATLPEQPYAVGGLTLGADPIVSAIQLRALERGQSYEGFYVRKEPKKHGTRQWLENKPPRGSKVVIVDDVVTTGRSVVAAIDRAVENGCEVVAVICLIDRGQGGADEIMRANPNYHCVYTVADFPEAQKPAEARAGT